MTILSYANLRQVGTEEFKILGLEFDAEVERFESNLPSLSFYEWVGQIDPALGKSFPAAAFPSPVGTVDLGEGIEPDSLAVAWRVAKGWNPLASSPPAASAGVVEISLAGVPDDATLRISVSDASGNVTTVEHPRALLREP